MNAGVTRAPRLADGAIAPASEVDRGGRRALQVRGVRDEARALRFVHPQSDIRDAQIGLFAAQRVLDAWLRDT